MQHHEYKRIIENLGLDDNMTKKLIGSLTYDTNEFSLTINTKDEETIITFNYPRGSQRIFKLYNKLILECIKDYDAERNVT